MSYSDDYRAGWAAARAQYQVTGGVQPYPPPEPVTPPPPAPPPVKEPERAKVPPGPPRKGPPRKTKAGD